MIRSFLAAIFALLLAAPALAEPPLCRGNNLLDQLKAMDPKAHEEVMAEARAIINQEAMLWRIAGKDGAPDSYLFGTAHVTDPRILDLPEQANAALDGARIVALEVKEAASMSEMAASVFKHVHLMAMPNAGTLWDVIPDEREVLILNNVNIPPGTAPALGGFQPWVVAAQLSIPLCETQRKQAGLNFLDQEIGRRALANGAELVGLETLEEQLSIFAGMPMDQQVDYLLATAEAGPIIPDYFETLLDLYVARQVSAILVLSRRMFPGDARSLAIMSFIEINLIEKRNVTMHNRALALLKRGNAFIAVGALHLPGDRGLVALLRDSGYTLTPVD